MENILVLNCGFTMSLMTVHLKPQRLSIGGGVKMEAGIGDFLESFLVPTVD